MNGAIRLLLELVAPIGAGALALLLAGCGSAAPITVPERVSVEVPVPCVRAADVPPRPALRSETDLMALPRGTRTLATWSERANLEAYALRLEAIAQGCSRLPAADRPP